MTKKKVTEFQLIANSKGWKYEEIANRWEISARQLTRIAASGSQRHIDSVNGLPDKKDKSKTQHSDTNSPTI